jgi:LPXTG-motif cell wall-anchored protein
MYEQKRWGTWTVSVALAVTIVLYTSALPMDSAASPLAQTAPVLGTAASFAVLGGSTVTNTGPTTVSGDLGVSPGSAVTGFPPGTVTNGSIHAADAVAAQAQSSTTAAYNNLAGQPCPPGNNLTGTDLGGRTLTPGVYCFSTSAQLTGPLTLNAQGNANAVFIFQIGSTLTTASGASVLLINSASACNVFWQVGSSATLGTTTSFLGNILALTSISLGNGATLSPGRALARNGAVTMNTNTVSAGVCAAPPAPTNTPTSTATRTATATGSVTPTLLPGPAATATAIQAATATAIAADNGNGNANSNDNEDDNDNQGDNGNENEDDNENRDDDDNDNQRRTVTRTATPTLAPTRQAVIVTSTSIAVAATAAPVATATVAPAVTATMAIDPAPSTPAVFSPTGPATVTSSPTREIRVPTQLPRTGGSSLPFGPAAIGFGLIVTGWAVVVQRRRRAGR